MRPGGYLTKHYLLCNPPPEKNSKPVIEFFFCHKVSVFCRKLHSITKRRYTPWNNGYFMYLIGCFEQFCHKRMPCFMISHNFFFLYIHHPFFLLKTTYYPIYSFFKFLHGNLVFAFSCGKQRRFVYDVCKVGAHKTWCSRGNYRQVDIVSRLYPIYMNLQYLFPTLYIRPVNKHVSVKPSWP
ncbi:MAG: hypothetical protein BWX58_00731 [Deltaproteobacteria bacterium ADurb.Bin026]|nr:MAG: hypothetical protein BWX58_00731 [Deltaproteobacteria bacterium ADurb.Bin026]